MANEILIIGVGSAGVIAADKMDLPNSKKLFIDTSSQTFREVKSEGDNLPLHPTTSHETGGGSESGALSGNLSKVTKSSATLCPFRGCKVAEFL